jgi:hypothetical protein
MAKELSGRADELSVIRGMKMVLEGCCSGLTGVRVR